MSNSRKTLWFVVQVTGPHLLAFIESNTDRNIIMDDSTSKHCVVAAATVFE